MPSSGEYTDTVVHLYNGTVVSKKGNKLLVHTTWMSLQSIMFSEKSLTQKAIYCVTP